MHRGMDRWDLLQIKSPASIFHLTTTTKHYVYSKESSATAHRLHCPLGTEWETGSKRVNRWLATVTLK